MNLPTPAIGRRLTRTAALAVAWAATCALAADVDAVKPHLEKTILPGGTAVVEVKQFCRSRVPTMPKFNSPQAWQKFAAETRQNLLDRVVLRGEAQAWQRAKPQVVWQGSLDGRGFRIRKLRYEAVPGMWIPALLYEPTKKPGGKLPVVLNVNGHDRTGKAAPYKQIRCINQALRGMYALNVEWVGMGQLATPGMNHALMNQLDLCGTSGLAPYYLSMTRGLDVLLSLDDADPKRVAVAGLSGGGWQTIMVSALDTRVTLSNPVAGYSSFLTRLEYDKDMGDSEQTPCDLATLADYTHLTAMLAPRAALLTYNIRDNCCFESGYALPPLIGAARPIYQLLGRAGSLDSHVNKDPGTHNFEKDNRQALYRAMGRHFFAGSDGFDAVEIDCDDQLKSAEQLQVELPKDNATFNSLAQQLAKSLPRDPKLPAAAAAAKWQAKQRKSLGELASVRSLAVKATSIGQAKAGPAQVTYWRLHLGEEWTVPAVEFAPPQGKNTVVLASESGKAGAADTVAKLLAAGHRVVAVDPFLYGEQNLGTRGAWLLGLLVSSVGERPLGLQASQLAAVTRWLASRDDTGAITLQASGPRSSLAALVAGAIETKAIAGLELNDAHGSLKNLLDINASVRGVPDGYCFGLLEQFDVLQLAALVAPRPVKFVNADDSAKEELAPLADFYRALGAAFQPLDQ